MKDNQILEIAIDFALDIIGLYKKLVNEKKEYVISKQLLRAGTSIGANLKEADLAISKKEFIAKAQIALKEAAEKKAERDVKEAAINKVVENAELEVPESMIETRVQGMLNEFVYSLQRQGISLDYYLQATNNSLEDIKEAYHAGAEASVKGDLVLEAIGKAEGIESSPEDVDEELNKMAEQVKKEPAEIRELMEKQGQISSLEFSIMIDKVVDFIISEAKILSK